MPAGVTTFLAAAGGRGTVSVRCRTRRPVAPRRGAMNRRAIGAWVLTVAALGAVAPAVARADDEVIENVVVRNRLFSLAHRPEVSPSLGISIGDRLTNHYMLNVA